MIEDWDDAYANRDHIPGADDFIARWEAEAAAFCSAMGERAEFDVAYGPAERNKLDIFRPEAASQGLVFFVHGGYWRAFDKSYWSHLAAGAVSRGWTVAVPSYTLAPDIAISGITQEIRAALEHAARAVSGPIRMTGHSAGGHLVTRMLCQDVGLSGDLMSRIAHTVSISGVHDLRPLIRTAMNADLRLDEARAVAESPALLRPVEGARVTVWVGNDERPEFVRQSTLLANIWTGLGADTAQIKDRGKHHFDVIDGLSAPASALTNCLLG